MTKTRLVLAILAAGAISVLGEDSASQVDAWKKPVPEWTVDDAHQIMTDSPWVKTTTPTMEGRANGGQRRRAGGGGSRGGGIGIGGVGIGLPGGIGRPRGYPGGGGYPGGNPPNPGAGYPDDGGRTEPVTPPKLTLRWESALPVRAAELRGRDVDAPTVDENHYAIAVLGVPRSMLKADTRAMENELKKEAVLRRDGKKDFKPSSVQILQRDDGPVIVYFFSKSNEISASDRRVEFEAQIGRLKFGEAFFTEDMMYDGKLAL